MELTPGVKTDESGLGGVYIRASTGALVPMAAFTTVIRTVAKTSINHVGHLKAVPCHSTGAGRRQSGPALGQATRRGGTAFDGPLHAVVAVSAAGN